MTRLDRYGDPLPPFALARLGTSRWGHRGAVDALAFSRDGRVVFAAGGNVTAIDVATGATRWAVADPAATDLALLPGPEGDRLAAAGRNGALTLYAADDGARLQERSLSSEALGALAVAPDGRTIFAGGALLERDGSLRVALARDDARRFHRGAFSPDGATLATADLFARGVTLWSAADGRRMRSLDADLLPNHLAFTPDGRRLVVAGAIGWITVLDVASGEVVAHWEAHRGATRSVAIPPDGRRVVSLGEYGAVSLWRLDDGGLLATRGGTYRTPALALSLDGATLAHSRGGAVEVVDLAAFEERAPPPVHAASVVSVAVSCDDTVVVTTTRAGEAHGWSMEDGRPVAAVSLRALGAKLRPLPEGDRYATMPPCADGIEGIDVTPLALTKWLEKSGGEEEKWWGRAAEATQFNGWLTLINARGERHTHRSAPHRLAITPDDRHAVFLDRKALTVWDLDAHVAVTIAKVRLAAGLAMSPDGREVAVWSTVGVKRFGVPDGALLATWKSPKGVLVTAAAYAPDGARMAVVTMDALRLIDVASGAELARMEGHGGLLASVTFDHGGGRLVSACEGANALVWSVAEAIAGYAPPSAKAAKSGKRSRAPIG